MQLFKHMFTNYMMSCYAYKRGRGGVVKLLSLKTLQDSCLLDLIEDHFQVFSKNSSSLILTLFTHG